MYFGRRLTLTGVATLVLTSSAAAEPRSAAVVPLLAVNLSVDESDALTARLAAALTEARGAMVRGGRPVRRRLPEDGLPADCTVSRDCITTVRAAVEADLLVFVVLTRLGAEVQIDPTVVTYGHAEARPALRGTWFDTQRPRWWATRVKDWLPTHAAPVAVVGDTAWKVPAWPELTLGGLSVLTAAVGVGFGLSAKAGADDLADDGCDQTPCSSVAIDRVANQARVADVLYVVSGVTATAAVLTYLLLDDEPDVALSVGPTTLGVRARF